MKVLIVDDDPKLRDLLARGLVEHGFVAEAVEDSDRALERLERDGGRPYDAVLLDIMLPGRSGLELLELLKGRRIDVPVLFLSALGEVSDRVAGLRLGADDYLVKPFALDELVARLQAVVRRHGRSRIVRGRLAIDVAARTVEFDSRRVELSPREFDVLRALVAADGQVLSRETLLARVWGIEFDPGTNVVDAAVARLRRRFTGRGPCPIQTVVGRGYRFADGARAT